MCLLIVHLLTIFIISLIFLAQTFQTLKHYDHNVKVGIMKPKLYDFTLHGVSILSKPKTYKEALKVHK